MAHFIDKLQSVSGKLTRVASIDKVAEVVAAHLQSYDLGDAIVVAPDASLEGIPWSNRLQRGTPRRCQVQRPGDCHRRLRRRRRNRQRGAFVLCRESPTTLNFLPDDHLVVVRESQIVAHIDDVWARMRKRQTRHAAHRELHHRPVKDRRRGTNHPGGRPRPAPPARYSGSGLKAQSKPVATRLPCRDTRRRHWERRASALTKALIPTPSSKAWFGQTLSTTTTPRCTPSNARRVHDDAGLTVADAYAIAGRDVALAAMSSGCTSTVGRFLCWKWMWVFP